MNTSKSFNTLFVLLAIFAIIANSCKKEENADSDNNNSINNPPTAAFTITPSTGTTETLFEFDASGSSDKEDALSVLKVRWDWENDGTWDTDWSSNKKINHNYTNPGNFTIALEVKDSQGLANSETHNVAVQEEYNNTPPNAIFTISPTSGTTSTIFVFDGSDSYDNEDPVEDLQVRWDFDGDGNWDTNWDFDKIENHQYSSEDDYTAIIEVKDAEGLTDQQTQIVNVSSGGGQGEPCPGTPTIYYEGQTYNTVLIGDQCWMKENLNVGTRIDSTENMSNNGLIEKYCYRDNPSNCNFYGGLYQWDELMGYTTISGARGICPNGWHVPSNEEWKILEGTVDSKYDIGDPEWDNIGEYRGYDAGIKLKSENSWNGGGNGTNDFGFTAFPGGVRYTNGRFRDLGRMLPLWSSSEYSTTSAWYRIIMDCNNGILLHQLGNVKYTGQYIRCIRDY